MGTLAAGDAVKRALGMLRVNDGAIDTDPIEFRDVIARLNDMMNLWESMGLSLGWQDVANPTDVLPTPPNANFAIYSNLAKFLIDDYGATMSPQNLAAADEAFEMLQNNQAVVTAEYCDYADLPRGQGQQTGSSWRDGFYK